MSALHERLPPIDGFLTRPPTPALAAYVQRFWWLEGEAAAGVLVNPNGFDRHALGLQFSLAGRDVIHGKRQMPQPLRLRPRGARRGGASGKENSSICPPSGKARSSL